MLAKLNPILQRFMAFALILNGTLLLINYFKKTAPPDWSDFILWIGIANIVVGLVVYISGFLSRRRALRDEGQG